MSSVGPTNPFHIARAYQVQPVSARPALSAKSTDPVGAIKPRTAETAKPSVNRMLAGVVPGRVSFNGADPAQAGPALPMYRHPADKNAVATALSAGRVIDVQG